MPNHWSSERALSVILTKPANKSDMLSLPRLDSQLLDFLKVYFQIQSISLQIFPGCAVFELQTRWSQPTVQQPSPRQVSGLAMNSSSIFLRYLATAQSSISWLLGLVLASNHWCSTNQCCQWWKVTNKIRTGRVMSVILAPRRKLLTLVSPPMSQKRSKTLPSVP